MASRRPKLVAINHDDHAARYVGRTQDGRQFFATTPFVPASRVEAGREFIAVYLFDPKGGLLEARIEDLGPRAQVDDLHARRLFAERLADLGAVEYCRIQVQPFEVTRFDVAFGLILRPPDDEDDDEWCVEAQPGNYMAFYEPWDSGDYDT